MSRHSSLRKKTQALGALDGTSLAAPGGHWGGQGAESSRFAWDVPGFTIECPSFSDSPVPSRQGRVAPWREVTGPSLRSLPPGLASLGHPTQPCLHRPRPAGKGQVGGPALSACLAPGARSLEVPHPQGLQNPGWL